MQVKRGSNRIVLLLPLLGIAVKFPRIHLVEFTKSLWFGYVVRRYWAGLRWFLTAPTSHMGGSRYLLWKGFSDNMSEFTFYLKTRNAFAWPTYFSLFGVFNIQSLGTLPKWDEADEIWQVIVGITGGYIKDTHCFADRSNYCRTKDGKLYLLDYASEDSQHILQTHESELRRLL